jgi:hypothetical protein
VGVADAVAVALAVGVGDAVTLEVEVAVLLAVDVDVGVGVSSGRHGRGACLKLKATSKAWHGLKARPSEAGVIHPQIAGSAPKGYQYSRRAQWIAGRLPKRHKYH